jgi:glutaredoxin 3
MAAPFDVRTIAPGSRLELYISPTCPYCKAAIKHYEQSRIPFVCHDAQNDAQARRRMFEYTAGDPTVPAIIVDGRYVQSGWGSPPSG